MSMLLFLMPVIFRTTFDNTLVNNTVITTQRYEYNQYIINRTKGRISTHVRVFFLNRQYTRAIYFF